MDNIDLFEEGRQDALKELEKIIERRSKFNKECIENNDREFAYTKEQMKAFDQIYSELQTCISFLKTKKRDSQIHGDKNTKVF